MTQLEEIARRRILLLDGAMGTMIQQFGLTEADYRGTRFAAASVGQKGNNDVLVLTRPDVIRDIHRRYLEAGADIIETNTFSSQRISQADYGLEDHVREMNLAAVALAREEADSYTARNPQKPRFVAGSVGPTNKTCSMSPDVENPALRALTFEELAAAYREQMEALVEGGVDVLLIETIFDTLNAKAAIVAAVETMEKLGRRVPLMLSATVADRAGRMLAGQTLEAFLTSVAHAPLLSVGLNCSFGAADMKPFLQRLSAIAPCLVSAYPNAGLPNQLGQYDQTPQMMAGQVAEFVREGWVNIVGGCCGTTDRHIRAIAECIEALQLPVSALRRPVQRPAALRLAGLEALEVKDGAPFLKIGERLNVAGSRKFLRLIKEKKYDEALAIARSQIEAGAGVIDINMDDGLLDARAEMVHFLRLLSAEPEVARVPFMIDSSKWEVIRAALGCVQGKCIVNSISLKEGEEVFLAHAREIRRTGAAVVVMAFDEKGQATDFQRRIEICGRAYRLLTEEVGMSPSDIIFDPNVLAVCTGMAEHDRTAADFIEAVRWIRQNLPGAHVSGGVSNLSFSFRGNNYIREALHAVFLHYAAAAGMEMGIVNPSAAIRYEDIPEAQRSVMEDVLLARRPDAGEALIALAAATAGSTLSHAAATTAAQGWREGALDERLAESLVRGIPDYLDADLTEALQAGREAVGIIEGPLMEGMTRVGKLFGEGKMFLPQVVKTARTMKHAVEILRPYIESGKTAGSSAGKVVLATVRGDVHDIGKNIVATVLACNNYDVVDLGVMVPPEKIVQAAINERADFVGLSGLITPSLDEMVTVARDMQQAGLSVPLVLGGATTSRLHTALKIAPEYRGAVVWVRDASQMVPVAARLMDMAGREAFCRSLEAEYAALRAEHAASKPTLPIEEARKTRLDLFSEK